MESDWWNLIDRAAARREQFPTLREIRKERPGCAADNRRQAYFREENRLSILAAEERRWKRSAERNAERHRINQQRAANAAYKARTRRNEEVA